MPKWIPEECGKIVDKTSAFLGRANSDADAAGFCDSHNADIDALGNERAAYAALLESHELILDALTASDSTLEKLREVVPTDRVQCTKCPSALDAYYLGCGEFKCEDCKRDFSLFDLINTLRAILYPTETPNEHE